MSGWYNRSKVSKKSKAFCEQIGHRSFVIVPHEMGVKKFL